MRSFSVFAAVSLFMCSAPAIAGPRLDRAVAAEKEWSQCVYASAEGMAGHAPAETAVEAAFGKCLDQEAEFRRRLTDFIHGPFGINDTVPGSEIERQLEIERRKIRSKATAKVVDATSSAH